MSFEIVDDEEAQLAPENEKVVDSSLDSHESQGSVRAIEFNEDGTVKKKMKKQVLEMVDLKQPMNKIGETTQRQLYSMPSNTSAANKRKKEKRKAKALEKALMLTS